MSFVDPTDESRIFRFSKFLFVYLPPLTNDERHDITSDLMPGKPPQLHYDGVIENYWTVIHENKFPSSGGRFELSQEELQWAKTLAVTIKDMIMLRK
jgi:hypothetical protein